MLSKHQFSFRRLLATIFSRFMEFPTDVPGLFTLGETRLDVAAWRRMLLDSNLSSQCVLEKVWFCKASKRKKHEFLVLYFRHWDPSVPATARVVVDRAPKSTPNDSGSSTPITHSSGIASPSVKQTPALDSVSTTPNTGTSTHQYLESRYGPYKHLCTLTFSPASTPPSAAQISVLLSVISTHAPNYHLYQFQCYWFASTIWEAIKHLFPGYLESTWQGIRSRCYGFEVDKADSIKVVCEEYANEQRRLENEAELKRQAEQARTQQIWMDGVAHGLAQRQAELDSHQVQLDSHQAELDSRQALIDRLLAENLQLRSTLG